MDKKDFHWQVGEAKQRFSALIRAARSGPQRIFNRKSLVAAVVNAETFESFQAWRERRKRSVADAFAELRQICAEEDYRLEIPRREDRLNPFADSANGLSR